MECDIKWGNVIWCLWQGDSDPASPLPSSGQKVNYQTDPRPHFGVACSSHSTCRPLWGSEGPCWGQRSQEGPDQTDTCPHCHLGLPPDTLRWHEVGPDARNQRHKESHILTPKPSAAFPLTVFFLSLSSQAKCLLFDGLRSAKK